MLRRSDGERFAVLVVVVSKCIEFEPVKWDGQMISCDIVKKLKPYVSFIPVCPEVEIGLGIPRETLRIVSMTSELRLIQPTTGLDFTDRMLSFAKAFLDSLPAIDGFILKNGSPSSALKDTKIYPTVSKLAPIGKDQASSGR